MHSVQITDNTNKITHHMEMMIRMHNKGEMDVTDTIEIKTDIINNGNRQHTMDIMDIEVTGINHVSRIMQIADLDIMLVIPATDTIAICLDDHVFIFDFSYL